MIKPLETKYKGYRFRSRLEARWAIFFDKLGLKFDYEPEGYELEDGKKYLPDFWIHLSTELLPGWGYYVEIKAIEPTIIEREKLYLLAKGTGHTVMCFWGQLSIDDWRVTIYKGQQNGKCVMTKGIFSADALGFIEEPIRIIDRVIVSNFHHLPFGYGWYGWEYQQQQYSDKLREIQMAFKAALSARFEHGELP